MADYAQHVGTRRTPQSATIPGKTMARNAAGGYVFPVDDWTRLDRFLVLGAEGGTYYASERELTRENAACVARCLAADAARTVRTVVEVSEAGRAPKNAPAVFALAMAAGTGHLAAVRAADALRRTCRVPTDLFAFARAVEQFRGWGRGLRSLVAGWYAAKPLDQLAYQMVKYQSRDGMSHRDLLRLSHATTAEPERSGLYRWAVAGAGGLGARTVARKKGKDASYPAVEDVPTIVAAFEQAKVAPDAAAVCRLVADHGLPRECVPTRWLDSPDVWAALLEKMPLHAVVRNLGKMTAVGLVAPLSEAARVVASRLGDGDYLRRSRMHPMSILMAARVYGQGHGIKGSLAWSPVSTVNDALDAAFYRAFGNVAPAGKRTLVALDVSGSMSSEVAGTPLSCREAAAALAMVTMRTEPEYHLLAFASGRGAMTTTGGPFSQNGIIPLDVSGCSRLADVVRRTAGLPFGGTDCGLPMLYAQARKLDVDTFQIYTDNETWAGNVHPCQALRSYRETSGHPARLAVAALTSSGFSIADPEDGGMLDVVGLDTATPTVLADFSRGGPAPPAGGDAGGQLEPS